tara:strand:- start:92 stop:478 length:387 start_codon:yes stop_codon:yes gene_type:complete
MTSETAVQNQTRRDFAYIGPCWRNNSGACYDETGRLIRYGLGNDSAQINREIKSSDLIGITPVLITPAMYGQILGVFTALECKPSTWNFNPSDDRARAQLKFHNIVRDAGGFAGFVNDPKQINGIIKR